MIDFRMDGLILVAPLLVPETIDRFARQVPIAVIGHHEDSARSFDTVNGDDHRNADLAVEVLVRQGHRDIQMLSLRVVRVPGANVSEQREMGYLDSMRAAGLSDRARPSCRAWPAGANRIMSSSSPPWRSGGAWDPQLGPRRGPTLLPRKWMPAGQDPPRGALNPPLRDAEFHETVTKLLERRFAPPLGVPQAAQSCLQTLPRRYPCPP